jgi:hypothetical protein
LSAIDGCDSLSLFKGRTVMALCPFATWKPISGPSGVYTGGPARIVHHTTEGSTAQAAFNEFKAHKSDPHFTVDRTTVYQHINTDVAARALRHPAGTPETNRLSAIQIEVVGFAGRPKDRRTLTNVARLCRWIEQQHSVPRVWPNGYPNPPRNGGDPGHHNRNLPNWQSKGGHYGHCHVPNNTHWDPAYTAEEVHFLMEAEFDSQAAAMNASHLGVAYEAIQKQDYPEDMRGADMGPLHAPVGRRVATKKSSARKPAKRARKKAAA